MALGETLKFESKGIKFDDGPVERFTARYPTMDEYIAYREKMAAIHTAKDKPGDPDPASKHMELFRHNFDAVRPLLTGYTRNGITIEDFGWREALEVDPRYMEVVAALGFELFRSASFEGDS